MKTLPAVLVCDEAGFGAPIDPNEARLWVSAVCVPEGRCTSLDGLALAKGRRASSRDRDIVADLLDSEPLILGAVAYFDAVHPEVRDYYSHKIDLGEISISGPAIFWSQAIANCCALVLSGLHRAEYPYSPITIIHDRMTMSSDHREGLRHVVENDIPHFMNEIVESLNRGGRTLSTHVPDVRMGEYEEAPEGALMLADFLASGSRRSWNDGDPDFMAPLAGSQILLGEDITSATLANVRAAIDRTRGKP